MRPNPLVSVIVPVYNAERFLRATLESFFAQDYEPFEVIVADDGSTDGSAEIARSFPDVRYFRQENQGPAAARNLAISEARGEIVANVDADDLVPPYKLAVQVRVLVEDPGVTCVLGRQEWIDPPEGLARDVVWGDLDGIPLNSLVARRDVLLDLGGYDVSLRGPEDIDLMVRLRERGFRYVVVPDIVVRRRYHGGNLVAGTLTSPLPLSSLKAKLDRERRARAATEEEPRA
jgi:glycosyltransferase involved in cell wall biosynthesis